MIRRAVLAILELALTIAGLACFTYNFNTEPIFGPPSPTEKAFTVASPVLGIALGGVGIWLIRLSMSRGESR